LFRQKGVDANGKVIGKLEATGLRPKCAERFAQSGIQIPPDLFMRNDW
jgi:pilus assembly protein CpaF